MAFRLKPHAEKLEKSDGNGNSGRLPRNTSIDSIASVIFPWKIVHQRRHAFVVGNQSGREIGPAGFYLCMAAVMLLSTGMGICAATVWAIVYRMPYMYLTNGTLPLTNDIFSLCAGLVSIPCFWIVWMSHDSPKHFRFLPLLMVMLGFCLIMLTTGTSMGMIYKFQINIDTKLKPPKLLHNQYQRLLNETMFNSMSLYRTNYRHQSAWDKVHQRLKCCGTSAFTDWDTIGTPASCCPSQLCDAGRMYTTGCIERVAFDLLWETSLILGLSCILFSVQLFTLCVASYTYVKGRAGLRDISGSVT